ncbi:hypothetical protein Taro_039644 [Colocasia esculenta]|uniref:Uncharacterized protein n=1 Tax=Colocasia esculenta TaxID=4460 RepID=A0A843W6X8_COLES|nr:hypothetical protein [Colocasia esculenta]
MKAETGAQDGVTGLGVGLDVEALNGDKDGVEGEVAARTVYFESIEMISSGEYRDMSLENSGKELWTFRFASVFECRLVWPSSTVVHGRAAPSLAMENVPVDPIDTELTVLTEEKTKETGDIREMIAIARALPVPKEMEQAANLMQASIEVDVDMGQRPGGLTPTSSRRPSMMPSTWDPMLTPVGMPGSSCLLKMGRVTWGGYNHREDAMGCSEVSAGGCRAGNSHHTCPPRPQVAQKPERLRAATCSGVISAINVVSSSEIRTDVRRRHYRRVPLEYETFMMTPLAIFFFAAHCAPRLLGMAQKRKEIVEASGMPPAGTKAVKLRSFEVLRECFRIGEEYDIVLMREDESYLTTRPGCFVLSLDLLEAGLRLPMPAIAKELLQS